MLRTIRALAVVVATTAAVWALRLALFGGVRIRIAGHLVRSYGILRSIEVAVAALAVFLIAGGWRLVVRWWPSPGAAWPALDPRVSEWIAVALAAAVLTITIAGAATTCGGADSSGYMSQADRWLAGTVTPALPWADVVPWPNAAWTFTPLGYTPSEHGPARMAPIYAPGLPWLLAAAKAIGGQAAMAFVVPICSAVLVLSTYGIGRRLRGPFAGLTAAWLVATSPIVLFMSMTAMSDVPAAAGWAAAFYLLLGDGAWSALAAGLSAAVAIAIRPNLFFLVGILGVWFVIRRADTGPAVWWRRLRDLACFAAGVAPGVIAIAVVFDRWYGSPLKSGYGGFADYLELAHVWPNLLAYGRRAMGSEPVLVTAAAAGFLQSLVWGRGNPRRAMAVAGAVVVGVIAEYSAYLVFGDWSSLRFFLPVWSLTAVAAGGAIAAVVERRSFVTGLVVVAAIAAAGVWGVRTARDRNAFAEVNDRHYAAVAKIVTDVVPPGGVVFSMQHSGSLRYYSGRMPIRYDLFVGAWLDRSVAWLSAAGVPSYAVLESWEVEPFRVRFPGERSLAALAVPVVVYHAYENRSTVYIYNLSSPPAPGTPAVVIREDNPSQWRNWPAGPEPTLRLTAK